MKLRMTFFLVPPFVQYMAFLERLARVMNMDTICRDVGFDMNGEALLARAEQLSKHEGGIVADKNTHVYALQRKVPCHSSCLIKVERI